MKKKCVVLFSGGLDSRLAVKLMQEKGFDILALFFKLPFINDDEISMRCFLKENKVKLKVFDCTKGELLEEYLEVIKNPKYRRGVGFNPCIDCKIFMFKTAKKFAEEKKINVFVTGEVEGQRLLSQTKSALKIIKEEVKFNGRFFRPILEIAFGRRRDKQIALARKFNIDYPSPAGGCLLCEKELKNRFKFLLNRGLSSDEIKLIKIGRHFFIDGCWVVLGKNQEENKVIEGFKGAIIPNFSGPSAVILDKCGKSLRDRVNELIRVYSKKGNLKHRSKFDKWRL